MKLIIQRVLRAKLSANEKVVSEIGPGLMVLVGITHTDTEVDVDNLVPKILNLKLWGDETKSWNKSLLELNYQILLVSQFTLYHQLKGSKPDFHAAMNGEQARVLYDMMLQKLEMQYG